jgi:hypothetical protein
MAKRAIMVLCGSTVQLEFSLPMTRQPALSLRFVLTATLTGAAAMAPAADQVTDRLHACTTEVNDARRLACYDAAIGRSAGQADDVGVTGELLRNKRREAGLTVKAPEDMSAKVVSVILPSTGKFLVTLDNGQVWRQQEALDFPLQAGDIVTVHHGLLGALWMINGHHNLETRVQRVQ